MTTSTILRAIARSPVLGGLLVGAAATEALDLVSIVVYEKESSLLRFRENRTRHFKHAYERAVSDFARKLGRPLTRKEMHVWGWRFHKTFGTATGLLYSALRKRYPRVGAGAGLAFGAAFFVIVDELLMPLQGWTPGPQAFSWKVHARGAAAHVAYGVAAELAWRALAALAEDNAGDRPALVDGASPRLAT